MHGSNKEQAAPEILHLKSFEIHASQTIGFIVRRKSLPKAIQSQPAVVEEYLIGISLFCISLFSSVLVFFFPPVQTSLP